ncbi:MAG: CatB-related O-acetyltransferase [Rhodospirillales bacterium]
MSKFARKLKRLFCGKSSRDILPDYVQVGTGTYGIDRNTFQGLSPDVPVTIGKYCSFGPEVMVFCKADHPTDLVSTYPLRTKILDPSQGNRDAVTKGGVSIGHDVWVGARAIILSGVSVGNGAVIGAGSVVAKDVPPYAIVAGNPGEIRKRRFSDEQIAALEDIAWWDWPVDRIRTAEADFYGDVDTFIDKSRSGG